MRDDLRQASASGLVHVAARTSPFLSDRIRAEIAAGGSVSDLLAAMRLPRAVAARIFVTKLPSSGRWVAADSFLVQDCDRERVFPAPGDVVTIRVIPQGGNKALAAVLELVVVAAAAAATFYIGGAGGILAAAGFSSAAAATGGVLVGSAVGLVGTLIARALIPPPIPAGPKFSTAPASFSISGNQNLLAPFAPVPRIYGSRLVSPLMAAAPFTENQGNNQYLRQLFVLGYGPVDVTQLKIRDTLLTDFEDVKWSALAGFPDDPPPPIYTGQVIEDDLEVLLAQAPNNVLDLTGWQKQTTGTACDEISVDVTFPSGLLTIGKGNGAHLWAQIAIAIRYAPTGTSSWTSRPWIVVNAATASVIRRGDLWEVPRGQYDVEVQALDVQVYKGDFTNPFVIDCYWTALRTIRRRSPISMPGLAVIGLRIRASSQLSGVVDQLNCVAGSILPDYDPATASWTDRAGAWFYDYDNQGAGASAYGLDSIAPHTTSAVTGRNFVTSEQFATGDGSSVTIAGTLASAPVQKDSLQGNTGAVPFLDDALGHIYCDGQNVAQWQAGATYGRNALVRYLGDGQVYISLQNSNQNYQPGSNPGWWTLAIVAGSIDYPSGRLSITFGVAPAADAPIYASYAQQVITAGAGKALTIATAAGGDGAAVAGKSIVVHQDPPDNFTAVLPARQFNVSGWYKASAPISAGIRMRVLFGVAEDFAVGAALAAVDIIANGAATTSWREASATVASPTTLAGEGQNFFMRVVIYHEPDGVGGVTVEWDDISVTMSAGLATQQLANPSFDFPGAITSNPAAHYRDVVQGPANKQPLADSRLDLAALADWWSDCDTNARNNNMIVDQQQTVFDTLRVIASMGRASFGMCDGLYAVVRDLPQAAPIQHFTPRNSWGFQSTRAFPQLPGALKVRFINPAADWQPDEQIVYDDGFTPANTALYEALDLTPGVTDPNQAWRDGRYHLAQARLRPETYQLSVDVENLVCQRGDLVFVSHDVPQWGLGAGRIKEVIIDSSGSATGVIIDESFSFAPENDYVIRVRRTVDGSSLLIPLLSPPAPGADESVSSSALTFASPIAPAAPQPETGDLVMFGLSGSETVQLLVTKIAPGADLSATLELVDYAPAVYSADATPAPTFTGARLYAPVTPPVIASARSDDRAMAKDADGSGTPRILIALDDSALQQLAQPPRVASGALPKIAGIRVQYRLSPTGNGATNGGAPWSSTQAYVVGDTVASNGYVWMCVEANTNQTPGTLDGSGNPYWTVLVTTVQPEAPEWTEMGLQTLGRLVHIEPVTPGAIYDVRIRYEMSDGSVTQWATLAAHQVAGQTTLPPDIDPTTLTAINLGGGSVQLRWSPLSWPNLADYEIRQGSTWAAGTLVWRGRSTAPSFYIGVSTPPVTYTYWVGVLDTSGNYDLTPQSVSISL